MKVAGWLLCACVLSAQTVTVTGRVKNAITHEPIEGVSVFLFSNGPQSVASDVSGGFRIPKVTSGKYRLVASKEGFEAAAKEIRVETGADPPSLDLTLVPWPRLQGVVRDQERQPVAGVRVRAISPSNPPGLIYEAITDTTGNYTFERLRPAQYRILATPSVAAHSMRPMELAPTWFPGVLDQRDAHPVSLAPGDSQFGCDIVLRLVSVFRLAGKVIDEQGEPAAGATVETDMAEQKAKARDDGTFQMARVRSGEGVLRAAWRRGDVNLRGFAKVAVSGHDEDDVLVRVTPPVTVLGEIELDGHRGRPSEGEAILEPVDGQGERARAHFGEEGIRFERVYPGQYRLIVLPDWMAGGYYFESVRLGERDITIGDFEVVPGMTPFRVVLRSGGGRLCGSVENGKGGLVVLTPKAEQWRFRPFIRIAFFEGGFFAVDDVRPGDYYVFALREGFDADQMQNPTYARAYLEAATTVQLERGATATITLRYLKQAPPQ